MRNIGQAVIAAVTMMALSSVAMAKIQLWQCQWSTSAGLQRVNGKWQLQQFAQKSPFLLATDNAVLINEVVEKALGRDFTPTECVPSLGSDIGLGTRRSYCHFEGATVAFNLFNGRGAVSQISDAVINSGYGEPDRLLVSYFTCQKY